MEGLYYGYGSDNVLRGLNLNLVDGEVYALLGTNGAGKTTLIQLLCGRRTPASGRVRVLGQCPRRVPGVRSALGLVPQGSAVYGHLSVLENLQVFAALAGLSGSALRSAVDRALELGCLNRHSGQRVSTLSGGWRRRVDIATALLHSPSLLMLDEPTAGVDPQARQDIQDSLCRLRAAGMSLLMTTHDLSQAEGLADRVGFLLDGQIVSEGRPQALLREHFAGSQELALVLSAPADAEQQAQLARLGLRAEAPGEELRYRGLTGLNLAEFEQGLAATGLRLAQLTRREPSLESLFHRVLHSRAGS